MAKLREVRAGLTKAARSVGTLQSYGSDWRTFCAWCLSAGRPPLPASAETVSLFLTSEIERGLRLTTVERRVCSIAWYHREAGVEPPMGADVRGVVSGARRQLKERPEGKAALTVADLSRMVAGLDLEDAAGCRDAAILLFGFASALRRAELVALDWADVRFSRDGVAVLVRTSKTDQEGAGCTLGVRRAGRVKLLCPVAALEAWRRMCPGDGPVFRRVVHGLVGAARLGAASVAAVVCRCAGAVGLDPREYGAHSLRAGFVTTALTSGADVVSVMERSRHKSVDMVRRYYRPQVFAADPLARAL